MLRIGQEVSQESRSFVIVRNLRSRIGRLWEAYPFLPKKDRRSHDDEKTTKIASINRQQNHHADKSRDDVERPFCEEMGKPGGNDRLPVLRNEKTGIVRAGNRHLKILSNGAGPRANASRHREECR